MNTSSTLQLTHWRMSPSSGVLPHGFLHRGPSWPEPRMSQLHPEQIGQQDGLVAVRAAAAHAQGSAEELARWAPALTEQALLAPWALVDRVCHQPLLALELLTDGRPVRENWLLTTQSKGALFARRRAVRRSARRQHGVAHRASAGGQSLWPSVTRAVMHGRGGRLGRAHAEHSAAAGCSTATRSGRGRVCWAMSSTSVQSSSKARTVLARQSWMCRWSVRSWPGANWPG